MNSKKEHLIYLNNKGCFKIECSLKIFSKEEVEILKKYGHWFNGLTNGALTPFSEEQVKFVNVFMNNTLPETEFEKIWFRYLGRMQLELENPNKFQLDYQIIEEGFHTREDYYKLHPTRKNRWQ